MGLTFSILVGRLTGCVSTQYNTQQLFAETENVFLNKEIGAQFVFNLNTDATVNGLTFSQGGKKMEGKK